jgi:hypothetical protein
LSAFAASPATISLGNAEAAVEPGREFTVPVAISDNPGFTAAILELTYDHEVLEPVRLAITDTLVDDILECDFNRADTVGYVSGSLANVTRNGVLFNVTFKVKEGVAAGGYTYSARLYQDLPKNFIDRELQTVAVAFQAGSVQVAAQSGGGDDPGGGGTGGGTGGTGAGTGMGGTGGTGGAGSGAGVSAGGADENTTVSGTSDTNVISGAGTNGQNIPDAPPPQSDGNTPVDRDIPDTDTPQSDSADEGFDFFALPWGWILLFLAVITGGLVFFLLNRRRRNEDEDQE